MRLGMMADDSAPTQRGATAFKERDDAFNN
jgi:hypothetical protein